MATGNDGPSGGGSGRKSGGGGRVEGGGGQTKSSTEGPKLIAEGSGGTADGGGKKSESPMKSPQAGATLSKANIAVAMCEWVTSHIRMSHVIHKCMSRVTHAGVRTMPHCKGMSHIGMSHSYVMYMNESFIRVCHDSFIRNSPFVLLRVYVS